MVLVGWFQGFGWWGTLLSCSIQNFVGALHIKSPPPATKKSYFTPAYWYLSLCVGQYDISTIIYWQVRIFSCPPRSLKRGQDKSHGTFQRYCLFYPFCLSAISLLWEETRIHVFKVDKACFYCPLRFKHYLCILIRFMDSFFLAYVGTILLEECLFSIFGTFWYQFYLRVS